jgi:hypothetical protein
VKPFPYNRAPFRYTLLNSPVFRRRSACRRPDRCMRSRRITLKDASVLWPGDA